MIRNFLNDIKIAKDNKAYLSALALALTIPDICGKIEYKYKDDRRKYIKWFNTWVYKYVEIPKSNIKNFNKYDELAKFDGKVCYALRCVFLHAGNDRIKNYDENKIKIDRFELCISDCECVSGEAHGCSISNDDIIEVHRRLNIENLLDGFISGIEDYLEQCGDDSNLYGTVRIINFNTNNNLWGVKYEKSI